MDLKRAALGYGALSNEVRLQTIRLLARAGQSGLASGEIARRLNIPANSVSQQLTLLSAAGLVKHEREGRNVFYMADFDALKRLGKFLAFDVAQSERV